MNIQSISSNANLVSMHNTQVRASSPHSVHPESLFSTDKIPVIPPRKIVELLSLVMSTPDLVRNHTGKNLDIRA
jgi:hypothetical protein